MALSDASEVDAAIIARLANDPTLAGLMPDGVFYDVAAPGSQSFVIVAQLDHGHENQLQQETAWETYLYLIKAVSLDTSGATIKQAAQRIHELMHNATIAAQGYSAMASKGMERIG